MTAREKFPIFAAMKLLFLLALFGAFPVRAFQKISLPVRLRPGVTATLSAHVYANPSAPRRGRILLFQHGLAHTANTARPLVEALFADPRLASRIAKVVALDLPGRGASSGPRGLLYGELSLHDYAQGFLSALQGLRDRGLLVDALVGHSMGGGIVTLAQEKLRVGGSTLASRFGIRNVLLIAATLPREVPWLLADTQFGGLLTVPNVRHTSSLGTYVDVQPLLWQNLFFSNHFFVYGRGTPSLALVDTRGYRAREPLRVCAELLGAWGHRRPSVRAGILAPERGSRTRVFAHTQDRNVSVSEQRALYRHLTRDPRDLRFQILGGADSIHDMYLADPEALIRAGAFRDL